MKDEIGGFIIKPGQEQQKALEFMKLISYSILSFKDQPVGLMAYKVLDAIYKELTQTDRDFGFNVSMSTEETPHFVDIMYDADISVYQSVVNSHTSFDMDDHDLSTREGCFRTFWHSCAQEVLQNLPLHSFEAAKLHIEQGVSSMFNGSNRCGYAFELSFAENDSEEGVVYSTKNIGYLIVPSTFSFWFTPPS